MFKVRCGYHSPRMQRGYRRLLISFAALSLLLCVISAATWTLGYSGTIRNPAVSDASWRFVNWRGQLVILHTRFVPTPPAAYITCDLRTNGKILLVLGKEMVFVPPAGEFTLPPRNPVTVLSRPYTALDLTSGWPSRNFFGFGFTSTPKPDPRKHLFLDAKAVVLPWWLLVLITAALPARGIWQWQKLRRRRDPRFCAGCGFDLRASPQRCPECGLAVIQQA